MCSSDLAATVFAVFVNRYPFGDIGTDGQALYLLGEAQEIRLGRYYPDSLVQRGTSKYYRQAETLLGRSLIEQMVKSKGNNSEQAQQFFALLDKMFTFDPEKRPIAGDLLDEPFCKTVESSHVEKSA